MVAFLLKALLPTLGDEALKTLYAYFTTVMHDRGLIRQGQAMQAAAETAQSARTNAAIAQAEADAPMSKDEALARLRSGNG